MDQGLVNWVMAAFGALILFVLNLFRSGMQDLRGSVRNLETSDNGLKDEISKLSILVAGEYVKRDEMEKLGNALFAKLDRIENKLDHKVDK